ncbi:NAD(P)-dependent alcohol dehydrogenase [Salipiger mucosus]|uniref:Alcohol dehydrogenase, zinc-containing n=1 Tax=Salipiger mucosus DSM 16094 TaxID=1123237 RepID=S9SA08_9RHOB|nr:NAD(P)-dependent alcohol dehydrogenase [Salipiger mucosus]EPX83074.1 alcohol dehydrogenase, zinc-containing [Salipiger mucosus DSM 16094]
MQAATARRYGPAESLRIEDLPVPVPGPGEILIRVEASSVTTADWRLRASAFPGGLWLAGRMVAGLLRPRNPVLGSDVAGTVAAVGAGVTRFAAGDRVFGFIGHGGHAEYAIARADGALQRTPDSLTDAEAAALPFGAFTALAFLRDVAQVRPGQAVLIVGASGGVGAYATQIAKALGAHVIAVASGANADLLRELGADEVIDYRAEDVRRHRDRYDLVFDTVGATDWPGMRRALKRGGLFLPLNFGLRDLCHMLRAKLAGGPRMVLHVSGDTAEALADIVAMIEAGKLRPVIDSHYPLARIAEAHAHVEGRHRRGAVVIDVAEGAARAA